MPEVHMKNLRKNTPLVLLQNNIGYDQNWTHLFIESQWTNEPLLKEEINTCLTITNNSVIWYDISIIIFCMTLMGWRFE